MKDIFTFLLINITKFGNLSTAHFYDEGYATIEIKDGDGKYVISVRREK